MNKNHNEKPHPLHAFSAEYARKGRAEIARIQAFLIKNSITLLNVTPLSITFVPWKIDDEVATRNLTGILTWNSIDCRLKIEYHLDLAFITETGKYSSVLKWYFSKWNEENGLSKGYDIKFLYSENTAPEIIIVVSGKISPAYIERKVKLFLLSLHDIMNSQYTIIHDITTGKCPDNLKWTLLKEIKGMLEELGIPQQGEKTDYGKNISI